MIRTLTGTISGHTPNAVILTVAGVGYLVHTPRPQQVPTATPITLQTYLAVRETALDLYGFLTDTDLQLFEALLTIQKIGPKSALDIMSKADTTTLLEAAHKKDASYLTKMSGIGAKTAEKIVAGLAPLAETHLPAGEDAGDTPAFVADAIDALVALGYPLADARGTVAALPDSVTTTNDAVREALKQLGQT